LGQKLDSILQQVDFATQTFNVRCPCLLFVHHWQPHCHCHRFYNCSTNMICFHFGGSGSNGNTMRTGTTIAAGFAYVRHNLCSSGNGHEEDTKNTVTAAIRRLQPVRVTKMANAESVKGLATGIVRLYARHVRD
jgi:hypothetical protein